jgi:N-acetylornithine carbamoyltransferase
MLRGKDLITLDDFSLDELNELLDLAARFKREGHGKLLEGKTLAMLFFNSSLRTRSAFDIGMAQLGGSVVEFQVGRDVWDLELEDGAVMTGDKAEHIKDAARVLSRYADAVGIRCFSSEKDWSNERRDLAVINLQKYADIPIINMESVLYHPTQALGDALTLREKLGALRGRSLNLAWVYSPRPQPLAVPHSVALMAAQFGLNLVITAPEDFPLDPEVLRRVRWNAERSQAKVRVEHGFQESIGPCDALYVHSWRSIHGFGSPDRERQARERHQDRRIDAALLSRTGGARLLHPMPVRRNVEATDEVLDGPASIIYDQAENRLHIQKAIFAAILGG